MMFGDNQVTVDHKKDGWYISFKYTDKRILNLLSYADKSIEIAKKIENKHIEDKKTKTKKKDNLGVRI